jgi:hypothetical protein
VKDILIYHLEVEFVKWDKSKKNKRQLIPYYCKVIHFPYHVIVYKFIGLTLLLEFDSERPECPQYPSLITRKLELNLLHVLSSSLTIQVMFGVDLNHIHILF